MRIALLLLLALSTPLMAGFKAKSEPASRTPAPSAPSRGAASLEGRWRFIDGDTTAEYVFHEDGSFSGRLLRKKEEVWKGYGTWRLDGKRLRYTVNHSNSEKVPLGTEDADELLEVTSDYYVIRNQNGETHKYVRVKP